MTSSLTVTSACSAANAKIYLPVSADPVTALPEVPHQGEQEWRKVASKKQTYQTTQKAQILNILPFKTRIGIKDSDSMNKTASH